MDRWLERGVGGVDVFDFPLFFFENFLFSCFEERETGRSDLSGEVFSPPKGGGTGREKGERGLVVRGARIDRDGKNV